MPQPVLHFPPPNHSLLSLVSFLAANQLLVSHNAVSVIHTIQSKSFIFFTHCRHRYLTGTCLTQCSHSHLFHTQQLQTVTCFTHCSHSYLAGTCFTHSSHSHLFHTQPSQTVTCFTHCSHSYLICTCCTQCGHRQLHNAVFAIYHHTYITKQVQITGVMEQWSVEGQDTGSRVSKMETTAGVRQQSGFICSAADNF